MGNSLGLLLTELGHITVATRGNWFEGRVSVAIRTTSPCQGRGWIASSSARIECVRFECGNLTRGQGHYGLPGDKFRGRRRNGSKERREERDCERGSCHDHMTEMSRLWNWTTTCEHKNALLQH